MVNNRPTFSWASETEISSVEWLWEPLIPLKMVTLVEGDGGDGKTSLLLALAAWLSVGKRPPVLKNGILYPQEPREPLNTFYATVENSASIMAIPRFLRNGGDRSHLAHSDGSDMFLIEDHIRAAIEFSNAKLVIFDPYTAFLPPDIGMGSIAKMRRLTKMLSRVAEETDTAIVLIGHMNKQTGQRDLHRGLGSVDISNSMRSILKVAVHSKEDNIRSVQVVKTNFDEGDMTPIYMGLDSSGAVLLLGTEKAEYHDTTETVYTDFVEENVPHKSKVEQAIDALNNLLASGDLPADEIRSKMKGLGVSERTLSRAKSQAGIKHYTRDGVSYWSSK